MPHTSATKAFNPTTNALRASTRRKPPRVSTVPNARTSAPSRTASAAIMTNASRLSRSNTTRLRNGQQTSPVSKGTSTRSVRSMARSFLPLARSVKCSSKASWHSSNDARRLLHQLAEGTGQPGGEQQQRSQRHAHRRDIAGGDSFARVFAIARPEQQSCEFVQHAAEDDDECHQHHEIGRA